MGLFWDLIQQSQISEQKNRAETLEIRVSHLEDEMRNLRKMFFKLVSILEKEYGKDIDGDGKIG